MNEPTRLTFQMIGCSVIAGCLIVFILRTGRSHWHLWLAVAAAVLLVFAIWAVLGTRRARKLDAEYGFAIVNLGMRTGKVQAFHNGVPAFSIPIDFDQIPPCVNFTAARIDIPDADVEAWRERLTEYLKRRMGRFVVT